MLSIRESKMPKSARPILLLATGLCLLAPLSGCSYRHNSPPVVLEEPVPADDAMQKRDWAQSTAFYPNGAVAAGPTQFNYEPTRNQTPEYKYYYGDSATFLVNMALLPYNLLKHPQGGVQIYPGETVLPTYTAQPALPPAYAMQPSTPPVIEQGAEPTTPKVIEPAAPETPAMPSTPTPNTEVKPQAATPAEPATPAAPAAKTVEPAPAVEPAPSAAPSAPIRPAQGVEPRTPRVVEPPPPQATKNLAPPMMRRSPATQPDMNK
jgi:hypothetical protein